MKSNKLGSATSSAEVVHVSSHGFWVFLEAQARELFLPFREFPWFTHASIHELSQIELERGHIIRWPALDVDLDIERIEHPERYPLIARRSGSRARPSPRARRSAKRAESSARPSGRTKRHRAQGKSPSTR